MEAAGSVLRQVRRVGRRHNLHVLQRAVYLLLAGLTAGAALLLLVALTASPLAFVVALAAAGAGAVAGAVATIRTIRRTWVPAARAPAWVDARAGLAGRLVTLAAFDGRGPAFFLPLVAAQAEARAPDWQPERLVPDRVPWGALAAALGALYGLGLVIAVAPRLRPPPVRVVAATGPRRGRAPTAAERALPRRLVAASELTAGEARGDEADDAAGASAGTGAAADRGPLADLARGLRERIRSRLWGLEPPIPAAAAASGATRTVAATAVPPRAGAASGGETAGAARAAPAPGAPGGTATGTGGAAGAGDGTDPQLLGVAAPLTHAGSGRFALGLAAYVHGPTGRPRPPAGEAPGPATDARPALAGRERADTAVPKAVVPPAWEPFVQALYGDQR
jgi:hypothetical protein